MQGEQAPPSGCPPRSRVRRSSFRGTGSLDGWSPKTESGLQACYGKSPGKRGFFYGPDSPATRQAAPRRARRRSRWNRSARSPGRRLLRLCRLRAAPRGNASTLSMRRAATNAACPDSLRASGYPRPRGARRSERGVDSAFTHSASVSAPEPDACPPYAHSAGTAAYSSTRRAAPASCTSISNG